MVWLDSLKLRSEKPLEEEIEVNSLPVYIYEELLCPDLFCGLAALEAAFCLHLSKQGERGNGHSYS